MSTTFPPRILSPITFKMSMDHSTIDSADERFKLPCRSCDDCILVAHGATVAQLVQLSSAHYEVCPRNAMTQSLALKNSVTGSATSGEIVAPLSTDSDFHHGHDGRASWTTPSSNELEIQRECLNRGPKRQISDFKAGTPEGSRKLKRRTRDFGEKSEDNQSDDTPNTHKEERSGNRNDIETTSEGKEEGEVRKSFKKRARKSKSVDASSESSDCADDASRRDKKKKPRKPSAQKVKRKETKPRKIRRPHRSLTDRRRVLYYDPFVSKYQVNSVTCNPCGDTICTDSRSEFYPGLYEKHKKTCPAIKRILGRRWDEDIDEVIVPTDTKGFDISLDLKSWLDAANVHAYHSFRSLYGIESLNELINTEKARILQIKKDQGPKAEIAVTEEIPVTEALPVLLFDPPPSRQPVLENVTESSDLNCPFAPNDGPREYFNVTSVKNIDRKLHYGDDYTLKAVYTIRRMFALDGTNYFEPKYRYSTYQELRSYGGEDELKYSSVNQD